VHLDISDAMNEREINHQSPKTPSPSPVRSEAVRRIQAAQRPVVIVGALATRRPWRNKLAKLKIPVFTTVAGKGAVDESIANAAGVFTNSGGVWAPETQILPLADLIVGLGLRTTEILEAKELPASSMMFDELPGRAAGLGAEIETVVDAEGSAEIIDILASKEWGLDKVQSTRKLLRQSLKLDDWLPAACFQILQESLTGPAVVFLDTGSFCVIGEHILVAKDSLSVLGSSFGRSMGVALPYGIGAAIGLRGRPIVVVLGDGGVRMYVESITLAARERLPLLVLLMTDGFFCSVRQAAASKDLSENLTRVPRVNWTSVFSSFGIASERLESTHGLEAAIRRWDANTGPLFLELVFPAETYRDMTLGLR
jgi:acetolactate synthase-1/2/3 large subunit